MKWPILVAESDAELRNDYAGFLADRGYAVEVSSNGLDCLNKLRQRMPAAVILDLGLPWGGGDGVLDWIREERSKHGIAVILTATAGYPGDFREFTEPPVGSVLRKPFALAALLEAVRCAVAKIPSAPTKSQRAHPELLSR